MAKAEMGPAYPGIKLPTGKEGGPHIRAGSLQVPILDVGSEPIVRCPLIPTSFHPGPLLPSVARPII